MLKKYITVLYDVDSETPLAKVHKSEGGTLFVVYV